MKFRVKSKVLFSGVTGPVTGSAHEGFVDIYIGDRFSIAG